MKIVIETILDQGFTIFTVSIEEREELHVSFHDDVHDTYTNSAKLTAETVFGLLEKKNPKAAKNKFAGRRE
jgi:hypothetical protein